MTTSEHWWGRQPPETVAVAWGARAIYALRDTPGGPVADIDLLPDRQSWGRGSFTADRCALSAWIRERGLPAIRRLCAEQFITGACAEVVSWREGRRTYSLAFQAWRRLARGAAAQGHRLEWRLVSPGGVPSADGEAA